MGLSGAGKTTVGRILADHLGWRMIDPDEVIVGETALDIAEIFRTRGEAAFREMESEAMQRALEQDAVVVSPGAGWAAQPHAWEGLPEGTVTAWLQVSPQDAARRLENDPVERPLLTRTDMAVRLAKLEDERTTAYARADIVVNTDGRTPEAVAEEISERLASEYGIDG